MYAIIKSGGKQYRVEKDQRLVIDKVPGEAGEKLTFDHVLFVSDKDPGTPTVPNATVEAQILSQKKGPKILIGKHKRRKDYQKINGFRPLITEVVIKKISA